MFHIRHTNTHTCTHTNENKYKSFVNNVITYNISITHPLIMTYSNAKAVCGY